jgi:hypothetical protein
MQPLDHRPPDPSHLQELFDLPKAAPREPRAESKDRLRSFRSNPREAAEVFDAGGVEVDRVVRSRSGEVLSIRCRRSA